MRILIAEVDLPLCDFLKDSLECERHQVDISHRGDDACRKIGEIEYEMFIFELDLPAMDGLSLLKRARITRPSLPMLVLTARKDIEDRVRCLDAGADDYVTKPFSFLELSARIRALLRRSHLPSDSVLKVGDLRLDRVEHRVERAGKRIDLTSKEYALLDYLMCNAGRRVTRDMIIEHVWNFDLPTGTTNVVDVYIMRKIVERSLRQAGVDLGTVAEASNGAEALTVLKENEVDLILCDINMPVMDGIEFVRRLQSVEQAKGVPVVMITTEGSESHVVQALSAGARGYIRKPFTAEQVKEHVLPVLGRKS
jgi:DNA-binding response OmpR family regulator